MTSSLQSGQISSQRSAARHRTHSGIAGSPQKFAFCWFPKLSSSFEIHCSPVSLACVENKSSNQF